MVFGDCDWRNVAAARDHCMANVVPRLREMGKQWRRALKDCEVRLQAPGIADVFLEHITWSLCHRLSIMSIPYKTDAARRGTARRFGDQRVTDPSTERVKRRSVTRLARHEAFGERQSVLSRE